MAKKKKTAKNLADEIAAKKKFMEESGATDLMKGLKRRPKGKKKKK